MARYDHEAIYKSHSNVVSIQDDIGCFDASGNIVTLVQSDIDAARAELDKLKYQIDRVSVASTVHYPNIDIQLDQLYHDINSGKFGSEAKNGDWFVGITSVKTAHPKPS